MTAPRDRRGRLREAGATLNGIDFVKVVTPTRLKVYFLNAVDLSAAGLTVAISGGESITGIKASVVGWTAEGTSAVLTTDTDRTGDFSDYTLTLVGPTPLLDPHLRSAVFSFKAECDTGMDCASPCPVCPPPDGDLPPIDYLARDYLSFRRALSDFSALRYPEWRERSEADFGMMFMETLCALADDLAYTQDRIAWEGKIETATQALSITRLARLVDYEPRLATIARVELQIEAAATGAIPAGMLVYATGPEGETIPFETGQGLSDTTSATVTPTWNRFAADGTARILPYWWDDSERCLFAGATDMWVTGKGFGFVAGMRLLIDTAAATTADPPTRQIVTLTKDGAETTDPLFGVDVTHIVWRTEDALLRDRDLRRTELAGNIVPATQGQRYNESFAIEKAPVSAPNLPLAIARTGPTPNVSPPGFRFRDGDDVPGRPCSEEDAPPAPWRYLYSLGNAPLAYLGPVEGDALPTPEVALEQVSPVPPPTWTFRRDLLNAAPFEEAYTLDPARYAVTGRRPSDGRSFYDYDGDAGATLRFGDGTFGEMPAVGAVFRVHYRVGGGKAGNVPPDTITRLAPDNAAALLALVGAVTNPLAATGGADAETADSVRQTAPFAFRAKQFRAVRREDYEAAAETFPFVQRAGTAFRWTGSWLTVFTAADPKGAYSLTDAQRIALINLLNRYRMAGYESYVRPPIYAPLDLIVTVCAKANAFRGDVREAVLNALSPQAFFQPDHFTFGVPLERSALEAAIQAQPGVAGVISIQYRRRGQIAHFVEMGPFVPVGRAEIIRVDNDPSRPEFGSLKVIVDGGK